jgi:hypothetical protein
VRLAVCREVVDVGYVAILDESAKFRLDLVKLSEGGINGG